MSSEKIALNIKRVHIQRFVISLLLGFGILYGIEHFGKFSYLHGYNPPQYEKPSFEVRVPYLTKATAIYYETYFGNKVETGGNGFTLYDLSNRDSDFHKYSSKSYYYTKATLMDYKYGVAFFIGLFVILTLFANVKIKIS